MIFKKSEPRKCHPTVALMVGALTVIGAVTVANVSRNLCAKMKSKMRSIWQPMQKSCSPICECEDDDC